MNASTDNGTRPHWSWSTAAHRALRSHGVRTVGYVPDAGLKDLLELCLRDPALRPIPLTTEEEGIGLALGSWLGGERAVLLFQSSGVGNLVNALGAARECRLPLVMLATMRGEEGELNPWQVPMGRATPKVLEAMGVMVRRVEKDSELGPTLDEAFRRAYGEDGAVAVLISQRMLGIKSFHQGPEPPRRMMDGEPSSAHPGGGRP
jgi:sulfopyruvate decarboxylase alpha subunit